MFYLLLSSFLWGTSFIAGKYAYIMIDPILLVQIRLIIASLCILPILKRYLPIISKISLSTWVQLLVISFFIYPVTFLLQFIGLKYTTASSATTMLGLAPLMVVLVGYIFFHDNIKKQDLLLSLIAFIGVSLVVGFTDKYDNISFFGCGLVILSTIVVGFWVILSKKLLSIIEPNIFTAITLLLGCITCIPITFLFSDLTIHNVNYVSVFSIIHLGLGCSFMASWLWNKGLTKQRVNISGLFLALEPVFGVLCSIILLGETLSIVTLIGCVLVCGASCISFIIPRFK